EAEMLQERNNVGEGFVKRRCVEAGRLHKKRALSINQRMRGFVDDDVVRQAREHCLARKIRPRVQARGRKIAKDQSPQVTTIVGIGLLYGMREDAELGAGWLIPRASVSKSPPDFASQGKLETPNGFTGDGVHHLLMKPRVRLARVEPAPDENS